MIVTTLPTLPGYRIKKIIGPVYGLTIRTRGLGGQIVASLEALVGGEVTAYVVEALKARREALQRMIDMAKKLGANAVIGIDFETSDIMNGAATMFSCYGTAVIVEKIDPDVEAVDYEEIANQIVLTKTKEDLSAEEAYNKLLMRYTLIYGGRAEKMLEKDIEQLMLREKISREEAIRKLLAK